VDGGVADDAIPASPDVVPALVDGGQGPDGAGPPFVLRRDDDQETFQLSPPRSSGEWAEADLAVARKAFARPGGPERDINPRLLSLIYQTMVHFKAPEVTLVSGYRPSSRSSYHAWGRAADFVLPGAKCQDVAAYLRRQGYVGVGLYPRTRRVHLDVRPQSYFWVSWAPPGKNWREKAMLAPLAREMDEAAQQRGLEPPPPLPSPGQQARVAKSMRRRARAKQAARRRARAKQAAKGGAGAKQAAKRRARAKQAARRRARAKQAARRRARAMQAAKRPARAKQATKRRARAKQAAKRPARAKRATKRRARAKQATPSRPGAKQGEKHRPRAKQAAQRPARKRREPSPKTGGTQSGG
jgi:hypothetical protein